MDTLKKYFTIDWIKSHVPAIILFFVVLLTGLFFYELNVLYPIYIDDWSYTFSMADGKRVDSFTSIIQSQYVHYFNWGGRVILHAIAQALLWFGESWANVLNTFAYLALGLIIYSISNNGNKANPVLFIFINIALWFFLPSFSQNILWTTGSANYLWGGLILFSFVLFYTSYYLKQASTEKDTLKCIGMFILGILAGWTNENMSIALIFFLIYLILLLKYEKKEIPKWMISGLIGAIMGCVVMLLSPGNAVRSKNDLWVAHKMHEMVPSFYFYRFVTVTKLAYQYLFVPVMIYAILIILFWWKGKTERKQQIFRLSLLFFCASVVATIVMSGSPMFPERAWFGIILLLVIGSVILYANIDLSSLVPKVINYTLFGVVFVIYLISCKSNYNDLVRFRETCDRREAVINEEISKGVKDVVVIDKCFYPTQSSLTTLDLQDWMMIDPAWDTRVGKYYGINTVTFKKQE